jgi:hypothetical protein
MCSSELAHRPWDGADDGPSGFLIAREVHEVIMLRVTLPDTIFSDPDYIAVTHNATGQWSLVLEFAALRELRGSAGKRLGNPGCLPPRVHCVGLSSCDGQRPRARPGRHSGMRKD